MQPKLLKYILDIESVIGEIESIKQITQNDFHNFSNDIIFQRAVEFPDNPNFYFNKTDLFHIDLILNYNF